MNNSIQNNDELPSVGKLIKSTILAIFVAAIILVTVVLPAEYGIDPTGIGSMLGLTKMGEIKVSLAQEAAMEELNISNTDSETPEKQIIEMKSDEINKINENTKSDKFTITLNPGEGKEIKFTMNKGGKVNYIWHTDGGMANFDAHADSKPLEIKYHNYEKGKLEKSEGVMEAAFDGNHGWFWRNRTDKPMTVTLEIDGEYSEVIQYN